jgi:predicted acylesterase/phospholipase RssA
MLQDDPAVLIPIRSYHSADMLDPITYTGKKWKIWQAARAATAAPIYFKPLELNGIKFIDAGAGCNNPSAEVYHEVTQRIPEYKGKPIACFVSIGTGSGGSQPAPAITERRDSFFNVPNARAVRDRASKLVQWLSNIATATDGVHEQMQRTHMENG